MNLKPKEKFTPVPLNEFYPIVEVVRNGEQIDIHFVDVVERRERTLATNLINEQTAKAVCHKLNTYSIIKEALKGLLSANDSWSREQAEKALALADGGK